MRIGSLFSGYGGLDLGVQSAIGGTVAWHVENNPAARRVLEHHWPTVPNHGDITRVDWASVEPVNVLTGGFPCQDVSSAGKRAGLTAGTRSGLWSHYRDAIEALQPALIVIENVRGLLSATAHRPDTARNLGCDLCDVADDQTPLRALGAVLGDLADLRYDTRWRSVRAADVGACHGRLRVFIVAHPRFGEFKDDSSRCAPSGGPPDRSWECTRRDVTADTRRARQRRGALDDGTHRPQLERRGQSHRLAVETRELAWGRYESAIRRHEHTLGRPAPEPTHRGRNGQPRLNPAFVEWMMMLPAGHVTAIPGVPRTGQLQLLGNGVVPAQAAAALHWMITGQQPRTTDGDLLPTPAVNDMGAGKTVEQWDNWTTTMRDLHGNGNGHGPSLAIEASRLADA